jgi:pyruvate carboxylase
LLAQLPELTLWMSPSMVRLHGGHLRLSAHLSFFLVLSGLTSQPAMGAVCGALEQTKLGTGIRHEDIQALNMYWSQIRLLYQCFEANVRASDSGVFDHEMPGGQYTNLQFQATQLGLGSMWTEIKQKYIQANQLCGDIIKVTPSR